ncbi:uncharacterized protein LOC126978301 [Leptidea sinapis]|uniref:uncharacterized protein LOC126978301 n=1 Tax=Leptidea sinapis TaxID=189913 RepID=UPI00213ED96C|nr:uncharacterized protein LOC126978301 [Leptidea sinapis]
MASCCACTSGGPSRGTAQSSLPLICLVPRDDSGRQTTSKQPSAPSTSAQSDFQLLDEDYIKKHFKLPQRALYLDPFRRPLITFPMTQEDVKHFNMARKTKINQQILDGFLDPSEAISAPSIFPYPKTDNSERKKDGDDDEEIIYILQLPDWEFKCPVHNETIRTPRFIWHSCKKKEKGSKSGELKRGGGPTNKPKPWLLSRHTDFDLLSQW